MAADKRGPLGSNDGSDSNADTNAKPRAKKPAFKVETLEPRILMSATWADAETGDAQSGATLDNDAFTGDESADLADGAAGNDLLSGLGGDDTLLGGEGNDTLLGGEGDDSLQGGSGNDAIDGGSGTDTASYADAGAAVTVNLGAGTATGGGGNDTLTSVENVTGSNFNDTLTGDTGANVLSGGDGNDTLAGGGGNDTLIGGSGTDTASYGGAGAAVTVNLASGSAIGGDGSDTLSGVENVTGSLHNDSLTGDSNANTLSGGSGSDILSGGGGNDSLQGGSGSDTLVGGLGNDAIDGGADTDHVTYSAASGAVTVNLNSGTAGGADGSDTISNVENLTGSSFNDTLTGSTGANTIDGGDGNDAIDGGGGNDSLVGGSGTDTLSFASSGSGVTANLAAGTASGTSSGSDTFSGFENLTGSASNDTLTGDSGNNVIDGGTGDDTLDGGLGDDTLIGGSGTDTATYAGATGSVNVNLTSNGATGAAGNDTLTGIENVTGSAYNDSLTGDSNANTLSGGSGSDILSGGGGNDSLQGGSGSDTLVGGLGNDAIDGGADTDHVTYSAASGAVTVNLNSGTAGGADGSDTISNVENLTGSSFNDTLTGSTGANTIDGGDGNDAIDGGGGNDSLVGGSGTDTLSFASSGSGVTANLAAGTASGTSSGSDTFSGFENLTGSASNDTLTGDSGNNVIDGGTGDDTLDGGLGNDTLIGGSGTDTATYAAASGSVNVNLTTNTVTGAAGNDTLSGIENATGSNFNDALAGNTGDNVLSGGGGDDNIDAGGGNDTVIGGSGNDSLVGGSGTDTLSFASSGSGVTTNLAAGTASGTSSGSDTFSGFENATGSAHDDNLIGSTGANTLVGGAGTDSISGGDGDDLLRGDAGNDTLDGGTGVDTASYEAATGGVTANLSSGSASGADGNDTLTNIENLTGSNYNDTLTGNAGANILEGRTGNDVIDGGAGVDTASYASAGSAVTVNLAAGTASGGAGNDTLSNIENVTGSGYNDTITGDSGSNVLSGGGGNDSIEGGLGNDTIDGGSGTDRVSYAGASGSVTVNLTSNTATGAAGTDALSSIEGVLGSGHNDTVTGNSGANTIEGAGGNDILDGAGGTDTVTYAGASAAVNVNLAAGTATGGAGSDTLSNFENATGSNFDDVLTGNSGNNVLSGGSGNDTLVGGLGNDTLAGGWGTDTVNYSAATGGVTVTLSSAGNGTASGADGSDSLSGIENITGSSHGDTLSGDSAANVIDAGDGNDTVNGGSGNDTLIGGGGTDTVTFATATSGVNVNLAGGTASGTSSGSDSLSGFENVTGTSHADTIAGDVGANVLSGGGGDDTLLGTRGNDSLVGGSGTDTANYTGVGIAVNADLQSGNAALVDGSSQTLSEIENLTGSSLSDTLAGDANSNVIDGGDGDDVISGRAGNDTLIGGSGNDTLDGGNDNDTLRGGAGDDTLIGGGGTDTADYSDAPGAVTVDLTLSTAQDTGSAGTDTLSGIERVVGSSHNDTFAFSNPAAGASYQVDGGGGTNAINLANFERADAVINKAAGTITLDLGGGQSATIQYSNVASLQFSDGTVLTTSTAPVANAGPDQTVNENDAVTLNASASSDADGDRLTYSWTQTSGPSVSLSGANGVTPSFSAPERLANTTLTFEVSVSDGTSTRTDTVSILVNANNDAPSASAGSDQTVSENAVVQLSGSGSDVEGQSLTYQWAQTAGPTVTLSNANAANATFTAPEGVSNTDVSFELRVSDGTNTSVDTVTIHVNASNEAPSANAGSDQTVSENAVVQLAGSGSDVEGQNLTYQWVQTAGPTVTLSNANAANPTFTAPEGLSNTDVSFELRVSDGTNTSVDTITVHVNADNDAPSANAGADQTVSENATVQLSGGGSDVEGQNLTYQWVQTAGPTVSLSDASAANPTFTAPEGVSNTDVSFELRVSDGTNTSVDTVTVHVNADNDAPSANAGSDQTVSENATVQLSGGGSDVEGQNLTYQWVQTAGPTVSLSDATAANPTFTAPEGLSNTDVSFELRVSDGTNTSVDTVTVHVNADNDAPSANAGSDQTVSENAVVQLSGGGSDVEGQNLTYQWVQTAGPTVSLSDASAANPTFTAPEGVSNTDVSFEIRVSDGTNTSVDTVTVHVNADNDAPLANAGIDDGSTSWFDAADPIADFGSFGAMASAFNDFSSTMDHTLSFSGLAMGEDLATQYQGSHGVSFQNTAGGQYGAHSGANVEGNGTVEHLTGYDGTYAPHGDSVYLKFSNNNPAAPFTIRFDEPVAQVGAMIAVGKEGPVHSVQITLFDAAGNQIGQQVVEPQLWDSTTANQNHEGFFAVKMDQAAISRVEILNLSQTNFSDALLIDNLAWSHDPAPAVSELTVVEGATVQLTSTAVDPENGPLQYEWVQTAGPSVTLSNASAANPTFTAPEGLSNTDVSFELRVSDGTNTSVDTVTVHVNADNDAPSANAGSDQTVSENATVQLSGGGSDVEGQNLTYQWVQTAGPSVTLSDATAANPTFTAPEGVSNTDVSFELRVSDGTNTSVDTVTVHVNADNDAPSANAGSDQTVTENATVQLPGGGSDVEGQNLTYQWVQTAGPSVTLSDATAANPTFTAPEGVSNTDVSFELRVSDGTNTSVDTVTVHVNADNDAPSANAGSDQTVSENATVQLSGGGSDVEGQNLTYQWVQTSGPTVTLSNANAANATFTAPEGVSNTDVSFELRVSDGTNTSVDTVTVHVNADNDAPSANAGSDQTVSENATVQLSGGGSDVEGQNLTYQWVQTSGPTVALSNANAANPTFTAPEGVSNTDVSFELRVSDGTNTSVDTVTIHVNADNDAPSADAGSDQTAVAGESVTLQSMSNDRDSAGLTYEWVQTGGPSVSLSDAHSAAPTFTVPNLSSGGEIRFELRVSDGTSTSIDTVSIHVAAAPVAPVVPPPAVATPEPVVAAPAPTPVEPSNTDPEPANVSTVESPVSEPQSPTPIAPIAAVQPTEAAEVVEEIVAPTSSDSSIATSPAASTAPEPAKADDGWDGSEDLQVLDASEGFATEVDEPTLVDAIDTVEPQLVPIDQMFAPTADITLAPDEPAREPVEFNASGAKFAAVFSPVGDLSPDAERGFVAERAASNASDAALPRPRWAEPSAQAFEANGGGVDTGLEDEYVGAAAQGDAAPTEKSVGMFAQLWGLMRGLAGSRSDDDARNRRR